jgi:hypothetical protein
VASSSLRVRWSASLYHNKYAGEGHREAMDD